MALAIFVALGQPIAAAQLCPLVSPTTASTTVTAAPNSYYAGTGTVAAGSKSITLGAQNGTGTAIGVNDEILIIQMQDSAINTTDSTAYGSNTGTGRGVTSDNTSGLYEYCVVTAVAGTTLTISCNGTGGGTINAYHTAAATATQGQQTYQVVRVPRYNNVTLNITGAADVAWNGASGGIFAIDASGSVTITGTLSVDATGFRGGGRLNQAGKAGAPDAPPFDYVVGGAIGYDADKGEGTVGTPQITYNGNGTSVTQAATDAMPGGSAGQGSPGNAGGGGTDADGTANDDNSGGGGGANGGDGGMGGNDWSPNETGSAAEGTGTVNPAAHIYAVGGLPGTAFAGRSVARAVMGGGGGAGTINNNSGTANISASGGVGGGMILIRAGSVTGGTLSADGGAGIGADNDGGGGGGAGGSIIVSATGTITSLTANATGGAGGSTRTTTATLTEKHGPGGGGGGGFVATSTAAGVTTNLAGGANGTTLSSQVPYGATPGANGNAVTTATPTSIPGVSSAAECIVNKLTIAKSGTANASPSGLVQYSIVISNAGPGRADGTTLSDPVPAGITPSKATCTAATGSVCGAVTLTGQTVTSTITTLPVGGSVTFTIDATAQSTPTVAGSPIVNTATVAPPATNTDPNATTSSASTAIMQTNGLMKTVRNLTTNEATGLTADTARPGDTLQYTLTFVNNTGANLSAFSVSDVTPLNTTFLAAACGALPAGVTACATTTPAVGATGTVTYTYTGTLNAGQTATFTLNVKVN